MAHFIGIHAVQAIPLITLGLSLLAVRFGRLADERVRVRLIRVIAGGYLGFVILTTWQAIRGQSVIAPDAATLLGLAIVLAATAGGVALTLLAARPVSPTPEPATAT